MQLILRLSAPSSQVIFLRISSLLAIFCCLTHYRFVIYRYERKRRLWLKVLSLSRFSKPTGAASRKSGYMSILSTTWNRRSLPRGLCALPAARLLVWVLPSLLLLPAWTFPRAAALLPFAPIQNESEEESPSPHSAAAQLQQLAATSAGRVRHPPLGRRFWMAPSRLRPASLRLTQFPAAAKAELARRNGCGATLRC
jgi:hypothetical protein